MKTRVTWLQGVCGPHSQIKFIQGCYSKRDKFSLVRCSAESGNVEKQLRSLDSYFGKLEGNATPLSPSDSSFQVIQQYNEKGQSISTPDCLESLNAYLGKLNNGTCICHNWSLAHVSNPEQAVDDKDTSEAMFQKAMVFTAASFILSHFCPIDDWSHFGAAITGMAYGYFTSPRFELKDASSSPSSSSSSSGIRGGQGEGLKMVRQSYRDSCRPAFVFTIFIVVLSSFLLFMEPPLNALAPAGDVVRDYLVYYLSESYLY